MKKKIKLVEVFPNFKTNRRFTVPTGKKYGNQLQAALDNGWTI